MKKLLTILSLATIFLFACEKEELNPVHVPKVTYQMTAYMNKITGNHLMSCEYLIDFGVWRQDTTRILNKVQNWSYSFVSPHEVFTPELKPRWSSVHEMDSIVITIYNYDTLFSRKSYY